MSKIKNSEDADIARIYGELSSKYSRVLKGSAILNRFGDLD